MKPPRYLGFQSQQRKGECFMQWPHCAGGARNTLLRGRRDDETAVFSPLVSNFANTPSLGHVSGDPLRSVAHALTQTFMKERSWSRSLHPRVNRSTGASSAKDGWGGAGCARGIGGRLTLRAKSRRDKLFEAYLDT